MWSRSVRQSTAGDTCAIELWYLNATLALTFISVLSSPQTHGTGVKYSGKRGPDDAESLQQRTSREGCVINVFIHLKCLHGPLLMTA